MKAIAIRTLRAGIGKSSLFAKALRRMLTSEQAARYAGTESSGK